MINENHNNEVEYIEPTIIDLNSSNVLSIYNDCKIENADIGKNKDDEIPIKIFSVEVCGKDSPIIIFSKEKINAHSLRIEYLFGQLKVAHQVDFEYFSLSAGFEKYTGEYWTDKNATLLAFYYLGVAADTLPMFVRTSDTKELVSSVVHIIATLSPNDPNFTAYHNEKNNCCE